VTYRRIARRYAAALFASASAQGLVDRVQTELEAAQGAIAADADLRAVLAHPEVPADRKQDIIGAVFAHFAPLSLALLGLLVRRARHAYLADIIDEYRHLADRARGVVRVRAASAVAMTEPQRERLRLALARKTGKRPEMRYEIDPSLLAGLVVTVDNEVIDASARGRLERMRELLTGARFRGLGQ
jgi:F-type H+-transporting ATPase subunit delta